MTGCPTCIITTVMPTLPHAIPLPPHHKNRTIEQILGPQLPVRRGFGLMQVALPKVEHLQEQHEGLQRVLIDLQGRLTHRDNELELQETREYPLQHCNKHL